MNQTIFIKEKQEWDANLSFYTTEEKSIFKKYLNKKALNFFLIKGGTVIDIGCATGEFLEILPKKCKKYGVDFSQTFVGYAAKKRPAIKFVKASADKLPFKNNYFDGIIFKGTLHHLKAQGILKESLMEADRVLKKGGKIYIHDRCRSFAGKILHDLAINLRKKLKKIKLNQATCASNHEPNFGTRDLSYLINTKKYKVSNQQYVLNFVFFLMVCFTNTVQYVVGFQIAEVLRYILYPLVLLSDLFFNQKNLTIEEFIILQKPLK